MIVFLNFNFFRYDTSESEAWFGSTFLFNLGQMFWAAFF